MESGQAVAEDRGGRDEDQYDTEGLYTAVEARPCLLPGDTLINVNRYKQ